MRRLVIIPEWDRFTVKYAADQRKLVDEVKKRLARWERLRIAAAPCAPFDYDALESRDPPQREPR